MRVLRLRPSKRPLRFAKSAFQDAVPPAACTYPLDDTSGVIAAAFGYGRLAVTAPGYQSYSYTSTGVGPDRIALPEATLSTAQLPRPASGATTAQLTTTAFDVPAVDQYNASAGLLLAKFTAGSLTGYVVLTLSQVGSGDPQCDLHVTGVNVENFGLGRPVAGAAVSMSVNADGTVTFTAAGVPRGTVPGLTVGAADTFVWGLFKNDGAAYTPALTSAGQLITDAASITEPVPQGATDLCGTVIAQPVDARWADTLMLVDFSWASGGQPATTDAKNGEAYTFNGTAEVRYGQLFMNGAGWIDTPDTAAHDPGVSPDTVEFLDFEVNNSAGGFQTVASNYDGVNVGFTIQRDGASLIYNTASGAQYLFPSVAGPGGWVLGEHYHIAFCRTPENVLQLWVDGVKHATEYTGVTSNIMGATSKFTFGRLPASTGITQFFEGKFRAFRLTDGVPRYTAPFTPPTMFARA